jgi:hypothetical protein
MKKITITMILSLVLALTATLALAGSPDSSGLAARLEERINSCELDVHNILASAPKSLAGTSDSAVIEARAKETSNFVARLDAKISSCETDLQSILRSAKPQTAIPGDLFDVDPQLDQIQMNGN